MYNILHICTYMQTSFYCTLCTSQTLFFYKLRMWGSLHTIVSFPEETVFQELGTIFPDNTCSILVSVSHFSSSPNISSFLLVIIFIMIIFDKWSFFSFFTEVSVQFSLVQFSRSVVSDSYSCIHFRCTA